ncbi:MAG: hypothetical protein II670_06750, partial [Alphaproteobacteria bacterium]|nr:hypothetical protein [Alphaproteobacteria bacterium]
MSNFILVIRYSDFFPFQRLDIVEELKKHNRDELVKAVSILGINYKNACFPDTTFFSDISVAYVKETNRRFKNRSKKVFN